MYYTKAKAGRGDELKGMAGRGKAWCFKKGAERSGRDRKGMGSLTYI